MVATSSPSPSSAAGSATAHLALARYLARHYWRRFDELVPFEELHSEALLALSRAARYYPDSPTFAKVAAVSMGRAVRQFCRWWLNRGGTAMGKIAEDDPSEHEPPDHRTLEADQACAQEELLAGFKELLGPRNWQIVWLALAEGQEYRPIAEAIGVSVQTVVNVIQASVKKIRQAYPDLIEGPPQLNRKKPHAKAEALKLLARGYTCRQIAQQLGVCQQIVFFWRKSARPALS